MYLIFRNTGDSDVYLQIWWLEEESGEEGQEMGMKNKGHHGKTREGQLDSATVLRVRWEDAPPPYDGEKWKWKSFSHVQLFVIAFPFSRGSSKTRDQTQVSHIAGRFFSIWATREAHKILGWPKTLFGFFCKML